MKLGERLLAIADLVPAGACLADIGTDHAYLPMYLLERGIITNAVAGEVHRGPYLSAQRAIQQAQLAEQISLRLGDGFSVLSVGEVDTAVIAGMGGATIVDILSQKPEVTNSIGRLILQPMIGGALLRHWLAENGWMIVDEVLVKEEQHLYEIIAAQPGQNQEYEEVLYEIGPVLWCKKPPLLQEHIENLHIHTTRILAQMVLSEEAKTTDKFIQYKRKAEMLEVKLACL